MSQQRRRVVQLVDPIRAGEMSLESAMSARRSVREYDQTPLTVAEVSQLLWAAQGVTSPRGFRTAPSAGALYPLLVHIVVGQVDGMEQGVYNYCPAEHDMVRVAEGDRRLDLATAAYDQEQVQHAAVVIALSAAYERIVQKYGQRGVPYTHMEAGMAAENVHLQAAALGLGTVIMGAFDDDRVRELIELGINEKPLVLMPVGRRR